MIKAGKNRRCLRRRGNVTVDRKTGEGVGNDVVLAFFVNEVGAEFFKEEAPAENALSSEFGEVVGEIFVIGVDVNGSTKEHRAKLLECLNHG